MAFRVTLFTTDGCAFCDHAKALLRKRGVPFEDVDLGSDAQLQAELAQVTGMTSFPQILVDLEPLGGFNELRAADKDGRLVSWRSG